jgi:hypothetical protein
MSLIHDVVKVRTALTVSAFVIIIP